MAANESHLKVLVVEDHDALREVTVETLEARGFRAIGVDCAEAVCELADQHDFDVAVLDLNLPGEDGLSLARRLRAVRPDLGIVMVTARDQLSDKITGYQHGADLYLIKPVDAEELGLAIQALARRLRPEPPQDQSGCLDRHSRNLIFPGGELTLTPDETTLLTALALAQDQSMASWQLLELLDRELNEHGKKQLEVLFSRLRGKLKAHGIERPIIRAERGRGYRLCLPLRLL
ncbi:response regulator transcription factor [Thiorhodococcus mannitoliphagus]|uniref:Response regulator transcription factor n=1 Tax=Thiorhodococcus mannitoliphagus TaxID=329406 RepID=A0A6P1DX74_9GAMM|nr:response regulator transcription factor [Thiorhodococcus mannitoliphagus]NEX22788.1 response regulator transcription factor [Thiorhodococcus mannitoliphagus]